MFDGRFHAAARFDVNPVSWRELARHAIAIRGPVLTSQDVWSDDVALGAYSHANLTAYWVGVTERLVQHRAEASTPAAAAWCVLGVSRLHHLLATGAMTSKSGAGRYALTAFGSQWRPIIAEALRARGFHGTVGLRRRSCGEMQGYDRLHGHGDRRWSGSGQRSRDHHQLGTGMGSWVLRRW
jgi:hypothetical protein